MTSAGTVVAMDCAQPSPRTAPLHFLTAAHINSTTIHSISPSLCLKFIWTLLIWWGGLFIADTCTLLGAIPNRKKRRNAWNLFSVFCNLALQVFMCVTEQKNWMHFVIVFGVVLQHGLLKKQKGNDVCLKHQTSSKIFRNSGRTQVPMSISPVLLIVCCVLQCQRQKVNEDIISKKGYRKNIVLLCKNNWLLIFCLCKGQNVVFGKVKYVNWRTDVVFSRE